MDILNDRYIEEQNKIASSGAWIWLLEIITIGQSTLRYANNNSAVVWPTTGGNTYSAISLAMDDLNVSTSGEFPEYKLQIGEVSLSSPLRTQIRNVSGLVGSTIRLMVVHSSHYDLATPAIDEVFDILSCELTAEAVTFTIGIPSLLSRRFPRDRYVPAFCRHNFGGALCRYVQPVRQVISNSVVFSVLTPAEYAGDPVNRITVNDANIVEDIFRYALPEGEERPLGKEPRGAWALSKDTGFTVSGSVSNDGFFLADSWYKVLPTHVYVAINPDSARAFVAETVTTVVTIRLGYNGCDHTLDACKLRDNTQNFGGSPGIAGGIYG